MQIQIVNRQSVARINVPALRELASHLAARLTVSATRRWVGLTVFVTDDPGSLAVKTRCFGKTISTDVVAAAYAPVPGDEPSGWTADVVINAERAMKGARNSATWSPGRELALYLAHGVDHLCGGRDNTIRGRLAMRRRDLRWLRDADRVGLISPLLRLTAGTQRLRSTRKCHAD